MSLNFPSVLFCLPLQESSKKKRKEKLDIKGKKRKNLDISDETYHWRKSQGFRRNHLRTLIETILTKKRGESDTLNDLWRSFTRNWTDEQIHSLFAPFVLEHTLWGKKEVWLWATYLICSDVEIGVLKGFRYKEYHVH